MNEPEIIIEANDNPTPAARAQIERGWLNLNWLGNHWGDLLPQAYGKFVVVAGQQGYVAGSVEEALAWAKANHPEDDGALVQYVRPEKGPKFYANRGEVASMP